MTEDQCDEAVTTATRRILAQIRAQGRLNPAWQSLPPDEIDFLNRETEGHVRHAISRIGLPTKSSRARYHEMLEQAMNRTTEGDSFLGKFVDMVLHEARMSKK